MTTYRLPTWALSAFALFAIAMGLMGAFNSVHTVAVIVWVILAVAGLWAAATVVRRR